MARNTKEKIIQAFFELALDNPSKSRFSIAEIAQQAGISRQAIYKKHFNSTEEIIEEVHRILYSEFSAVLQTYDRSTIADPFVFFANHFLPVFYKHRKWIQCFYTTAANPNWIPFFSSILLEFQNEHVSINHDVIQVPREKVSQLLVKGIMNLLEIWIVQPEPTPPEQFVQTFLFVIHFPISSYVARAENPQEQLPTSLFSE